MTKFSERLLTVIFVVTVILIVVNIFFFYVYGAYPEQMFHDWMQYIFGSECLILGIIKIAKVGSEAVVDKARIKKELEELKKMGESEAGK